MFVCFLEYKSRGDLLSKKVTMMILLYKHGCGGSTIYIGAQGILPYTMCRPTCVSQMAIPWNLEVQGAYLEYK